MNAAIVSRLLACHGVDYICMSQESSRFQQLFPEAVSFLVPILPPERARLST